MADNNMNNDQTVEGEENPSNVPNAADAALIPSTTQQYEIPPHPATPEEEKAIIKQLESKANDEGLKVGSTWYVMATKWLKHWKEYVQYEWYSSYSSYSSRSAPGPIDNTPIIEEPASGESAGEGKVKKSAMENYDYTIVSEEIWVTLLAWYGGGPPLPRKVIGAGWDGTNRIVEVRPLTLKICKSTALNEIVTATYSKSDSVGFLKRSMCEALGLREADTRIWDFHAFSKYKLLENMDQKLDAAQIIDGQPILLEEKDENGKFPELPKSKTSYSYGYSSGGPTDPGTTGLINLGNTCFMNSSLQCLSNTAPLTEYFLGNKYKDDINLDNPLGTKGELAEEYASLIKELWSGTHSAVAPRDFKYKLERFAPAFAGFQQHDAQELLSFLLDGLHEDLNRVKKKPYKERPETENLGELKFSEDLWNYHKERNDSIIVDWFQGQLKSTLVCPKCSKVSTTFDPMMYLSLPMPMKSDRIVYVTLFFADPQRKPTRYGCTVNKFGSVSDLKVALGELSGTKPDFLVIADVYNGRFFKQFNDKESLDAIQERDFICGYELVEPASENDDIGYISVVSRKEEPINYHPSYSSGTYTRKALFGIPFFLSIPNASTVTYQQLHELAASHFQRYLKASPKERMSTENEKSDDSEEDKEEEEDSDTEDDSDKEKASKKRKGQPLFTLRIVDNYGLTDQEVLKDDGKPLELSEKQTLALVWTEDMYDAFYDETKEKDFEHHESSKKTQDKEQEDSVPLSTCIDLFTETERLGPEDAWYCSNCKEHVQATKKFDLWKLPPILVIHLKRFSYKKRYWREKLETLVDYPLNDLDLSAYVKGPLPIPPIYDLYAVSNHFGSLGGGHYTAYGKNKNDKKWYKFDDSSVSKIDDQRARTASAYVLFYRRKDTLVSPPATITTTTTASKDEETDDMVQDNGSSQVRQSMDEDKMDEVQL